jgi:hypothetical protein
VSLSRNGRADYGVSVIRSGELAAACGAVTDVPLSDNVKVRMAAQELAAAEAVFRRTDDQFHFHEVPVAISVGTLTRFLYQARAELGGYSLWVEHGALPGLPGVSACLAMWKPAVCPDTVAISSALLLKASVMGR